MAKKQRRKQSRKPARQPAQSAAPGQPTGAARPAATPEAPTAQPTRKQGAMASWEEHAERYSYVNRELKNIGILAGSFLVVLLILSAIIG